MTETTSTPESVQFDTRFMHNFGSLEVIPKGAVALCGAISTRSKSGEMQPPRDKCCPICLALIENSD